MKVAFLIATLTGGGAEKVLLLLANEASLRGWDITVYTLARPPKLHQFHPNVKIEPVVDWPVKDRDVLIPLYAFFLYFKLLKLKPDLLLSWLPRSNFTVLAIKSFVSLPVWISEHLDTRYYLRKLGWRGKVAEFLTRKLYPSADGVITVSQGVRKGLCILGIPDEKLHVIYNPVEIIEEPPPESDNLMVVTMGRLSDQKNQSLLLRACQRLMKTHPVRLRLIGDGPERDRLTQEAKMLGIADRVEITGWLEHPSIALQGAGVFAFTSDCEGFGNAIIEAMACGLPIVATDCPSGPREILADGEFGFLVPVGDVAAVADSLDKLLSSTALRQAYRQKSLKRAKDFEVKKIVSQYCEVLQQGVRGRG